MISAYQYHFVFNLSCPDELMHDCMNGIGGVMVSSLATSVVDFHSNLNIESKGRHFILNIYVRISML